MPRPRRCRWIGFEPRFTRFGPMRRMISLETAITEKEPESITLTKGELEAIRLHDLEGIDQTKAAEKMKISQPTFHRTLLSARKKVADALVNGKAIKVEGGTYKMQQQTRPGFGAGRGRGRRAMGPPTFCVCPSCNHKQQKTAGLPCAQMKCEKCGALMMRGD